MTSGIIYGREALISQATGESLEEFLRTMVIHGPSKNARFPFGSCVPPRHTVSWAPEKCETRTNTTASGARGVNGETGQAE